MIPYRRSQRRKAANDYRRGVRLLRDIDFKRFREIADSVGAFLLADISHPSGLIAKGLLNDPIPHCHVVTTTTIKP